MVHFLYRIFAVISLVLAFSVAGPPQSAAQDVPAEYKGDFTCPKKFPGSFLDIGKNECWQCPASAPKRTVFPVDKGWACEKPAYEDFKRAAGPVNPTGLILKTDCQKGYFLDIGKGKCYSCKGYNRSAYPVTHARACSKVIPLKKSTATLRGKPGCGEGGFQHLFSGNCYVCPEGSYRNANTGSDPEKFGACTVCGTEGGKPCPVTTLRKSCNPGLVEDFLKGTCVIDNSHSGRVYRKAKEKGTTFAGDLATVLESALALEQNGSLKRNLSAQNDAAFNEVKPFMSLDTPCLINDYNSWTLGGTATAGVILSGTVETGMAVDIRHSARTNKETQRKAHWYGASSYDISLNAGASAGLAYGCWLGENNALYGDFEGAVFDVFDIVALKNAFALKDFSSIKEAFTKAGLSVEFGVWFDSKSGDYTGFSITPSYGPGFGLGGYVKGNTGQFVDGTYENEAKDNISQNTGGSSGGSGQSTGRSGSSTDSFAKAVASFGGSLNMANLDKSGHYLIGAADVTGDRKADLVSSNTDGSVYVWPGQSNGSFAKAVPSFGGSMNMANLDGSGHFIVGVADVTGDGKADLVGSNTNGSVYVWPGQSNGSFAKAVASFGGSMNMANLDKSGHYIVGVADVTGDRKADLVSSNTNGSVYVWPGQSDGSFAKAVASFDGTMKMANLGGSGHYIVGVSDVTGDGKADLVSGNTNGSAYVWPGQANGSFAKAVASFGGSLNMANVDKTGHYLIGAADVTGDGRADLVSGHTDGSVYMWPGQSNGSFGKAAASFGGSMNMANLDKSGHYIVGVSDVTGDGKADLVSGNTNGSAYVWPGR